jgi:hypothetical protein
MKIGEEDSDSDVDEANMASQPKTSALSGGGRKKTKRGAASAAPSSPPEDPPSPSDHGGNTPDDDPFHSDNEGENLMETMKGS